MEKLPATVWKVGAVATLGPLLAQLDATIVNVSLPSLATQLHSSLSTIQWVTSGYLLALALTLPLSGWLVDRIGAKAVYIFCFSAFTLTSGLCGFAWSASSLIAFRILQGMSGGLMAPMGQMVIARVAGRNMAQVLGYTAMVIVLGPILGPIIAGAILQHAVWRWLFLVNLPVGVLAVCLSILFLPSDKGETHPRNLDLVGLALLSPGLVLFLFGAEHVTDLLGQFTLVSGGVLIAAFLRWAGQRPGAALIDLRLFKGPVFPTSAMTQFLSNGTLFAGQMLLPFYLVRLLGMQPSAAGWMLAPMGLGMACSAPQIGKLTNRFGIRAISVTGALIGLVGTLPFIVLPGIQASSTIIAACLFVRGIGMGMVGIPSMTAAYASVPKDELPMAATSINIVQRVGGPTITTIAATFLAWRLGMSASGAAFSAGFALLCFFHVLALVSSTRLPVNLDRVPEPETAGREPQPHLVEVLTD